MATECCKSDDFVDQLHYVDVHAHLTHELFSGAENDIAICCKQSGIEWIVVNGLEPVSNRQVLSLCSQHDNLLAALGIYPIDAACNDINESNWKNDFSPPAKFNVDEEIDFIDLCASQGKLAAIGECGLDHFYVNDPILMLEQERVLRRLCKLSVRHNLPIILHSRKAERRVFEIIVEEGVQIADFHCFTGKSSLARTIAQSNPNYYFSIPAAVNRMPNFVKLVSILPPAQILTETDSPYLPPHPGQRNDPRNVISGVESMASILQMPKQDVMNLIRANFRKIFNR